MTLPSADRITAYVAPIVEKFGIPGLGVAVVSGDDTASYGFGVRDKETGGAVTGDTTFQLASCSKSYTATTLALLVDAGSLSWDDPVRKHLPEFQMHDERLSSLATVRDLLSMRLGYRNEGIVNWGRNLELGVSFIFERLKHMEVIAGFRELFTYLNPAYTLASEVAARVSGKPFIDFQRDELLKPLGQTNTFLQEGRLQPASAHAFPHVELDEGIVPVGMAHCGGRVGESCIYSSASDAVRWMQLHLGKGETQGRRLVSQAAMAEMHRPHVFGPPALALDNNILAYAMGWQCRDSPNGPVLLHEGGEFGVSTFTMLDPIRKLGVAVYANLNSSAGVKAATYGLIDILACREPRNWADLFAKLVAADFAMLNKHLDAQLAQHEQIGPSRSEIVGSYFHPANGVIDITETSDGYDARVRDGWVYDSVLQQVSGNLYAGKPRFKGMQSLARLGMRVRFFRDEQGLAVHAPGLGIARKFA